MIILEFSSDTEPTRLCVCVCVCVCVCKEREREREIYFKELAPVIVETWLS